MSFRFVGTRNAKASSPKRLSKERVAQYEIYGIMLICFRWIVPINSDEQMRCNENDLAGCVETMHGGLWTSRPTGLCHQVIVIQFRF